MDARNLAPLILDSVGTRGPRPPEFSGKARAPHSHKTLKSMDSDFRFQMELNTVPDSTDLGYNYIIV